MATQDARDLDLVLFGATGFTGRLVAEYLLSRGPGVRWAIAGRSADRLACVKDDLGARDVPVLVADTLDRAAVDAVVARTRVVCTTVGPFAKHGSEVVASCAAHGTSYCDITGETPWIRAMIARHDARARETGARIVPTCGFDSIPSDLGVLALHRHFAARGTRLASASYRVVTMKGGMSGGTAASLLDVLEGAARDPEVRRGLMDPYALDPAGSPRGPDANDAVGPGRDAVTGHWHGPFVMAAINTRVVRRSNALLDFAYGRDFRYDEAIDTGGGPLGLLRALGLSAGVAGAMALGATSAGRALARRVLPSPGEGPSKEARERGSYRIELHGIGADGARATGIVEGSRDPGYGDTARMLGESALCLATDALAPRAGLLTPASAMGDPLIARLVAAGISIRVEPAG